MEIVSYTGSDDLAKVYIAKTGEGKYIEFVESVQPPFTRRQKWVLIVSTLYGCPVGCSICDAGGFYKGKLSKEEIFSQIDFLVDNRYAGRVVPVDKFKIQFARMGEPSFNPDVLEVLRELPERYHASGLMPCISTVAPSVCDKFFDELIGINEDIYKGRFQLQFSIHTTNEEKRDSLIPVKKWSFSKIADYGKRFYSQGGRKVSLNFALEKNSPIDPDVLRRYFNPEIFLIKITPINPTYKASENMLTSYIDKEKQESDYKIVSNLRACGYDVIVSIGELRENNIGSNCGQYILKHLKENKTLKDSYTYSLENVEPCNAEIDD